ncbi:hypothetical protein F5J12DRAFT_416803 [Pisolithus orientalis]|uniref:uncharacterized protein n=1 Tax=Pisolithus orientalis TaxID=936130 RepID=UPI002225944C|nr:uncharacterized protein F5J12DRAFT_416803 [Pisolithus orientalis]KAI5994252.1 hypothetical protein F5J12DRAFT_416803 [Pisolithus orientalis]
MSGPSGATVENLSPPPPRTITNAGQRQTTPSNQGLSAASGQLHIHGVRVNDLIPWVTEDVRKAQQCEADKMLEYILRRASETPDDLENLDSYTLLGRCMAEVLGICNEEVKDINGFPVSNIKKALIEYTACAQEDGLYQPFVQASNTALAYLRELDIVGMRKGESAEVQIFFQRNDPKVISQRHAGHTSQRKPDIIAIPFTKGPQCSTETAPSGWGDHVSTIGPGKAPTASLWKDVLGVFEFKRSKSKKKMTAPPQKYGVSVYRPSKPMFLEIGKDGNEREAFAATRATLAAQALLGSTARNMTPQGTPAGSRKRTLGSDSESRASKRSRADEPRAHVTIQTALYVAEMQSANIGMKHGLNYIVIGDDIWIWYYDHQGLISVGGFNFVQDLPRFLVLLYALQRFNLEDWGRNTAFQPNLKGDRIESHTINVDGYTLTLDNSKRKTRLGLGGRGTHVMDVTCNTLMQENLTNSLDGAVAKIYWGEEARKEEEEILRCVENTAKTVGNVKEHVPVLILSKKFPVSTCKVRRALGLTNPEKGSRTLVLLVFKKLSPIEELPSDALVVAWWQCVLCHHALWNDGIHHRDVSVENLMYYKVGGKVMGVLNDYDLSSLASSPSPLGNERTGTIPFMAIDLLEEAGQNGNVKHQYRHDMESFIWVFIWISLQFKDGTSLDHGPLDSWAEVNAHRCVAMKRNFLMGSGLQVPGDTPNFALVLTLAKFLGQRLNARNDFIIDQRIALANKANGGPVTASQLEDTIKELDNDNQLAKETTDTEFRELRTALELYIDTDCVQ